MMIHLGTQAAFLACGLIALGLIFFVIGVTSAQPGRSSMRWPAVDGEVLSSRTAFDPMNGRNRVQVRYRYIVDGKPYTGSRIAFQEIALFNLFKEPAAEAQSYLPGQAVQVHYDPADPARSVLLPGSGPQAILPIGVGGLFFVLGLIAGILALI